MFSIPDSFQEAWDGSVLQVSRMCCFAGRRLTRKHLRILFEEIMINIIEQDTLKSRRGRCGCDRQLNCCLGRCPLYPTSGTKVRKQISFAKASTLNSSGTVALEGMLTSPGRSALVASLPPKHYHTTKSSIVATWTSRQRPLTGCIVLWLGHVQSGKHEPAPRHHFRSRTCAIDC